MNLLQKPTSDLVRKVNLAFNQDTRYGTADRALSIVFRQFPTNTVLEEIIVKVSLLDRLYNTNLYVPMEMAFHISNLKIDQELNEGNTNLIDRIAFIIIKGKKIRKYSFATKYCSWHLPEKYPIYDNLVDKLLWDYQCMYQFSNFRRAELTNYEKLKAVIDDFRKFFKLEEFTYKQIDKFLWGTMKEL